MANKIIATMIGLMMLMLLPMALAQDTNTDSGTSVIVDTTITPIDEKEARTMLSPFGAEVRMLQLEKSVTRNVLIGNEVLQVLSKNHTDANLTDAENTLNSLEMVLEDIKAAPTEGDKNVLVQTFIELKKEAKTLSNDFKQETKNIINAQDRQEIMTNIKDLDKNDLMDINNKIREILKNFNAEKMKEKFNQMGIKNEDMIGRIRNGDMNFKEIRDYALNQFRDLNETEKKQIAATMRNNTIKNMVQQREMTQKIIKDLRQNMLDKMQNRAENLSNWMERKALDANARGDFNITQRLENQNERLNQMIQRMEDRNGGRRQ